MRSWLGTWLTSSYADPVEATVLATDSELTIGYRLQDGSVHTQKWAIDEIQVSFDLSLQSSRIVYNSQPHAKLLIAGKDAMDFIAAAKTERQKPWHQKQQARDWVRGISIFAGVVSVLVAIYFMVVPWAAEKMAATVSPATEARLGNAVFEALSLSADENRESSALLNDFFSALKINTDYQVRLTVVKSEVVNAFALPGGNIVVYTGLLHRLQTYPELAALLSHEFTHVNKKHSTRSIFRQLGSRVFLGLLFGNFGSVTPVLIDQAEQRFKSLKYSRSLEKEADLEGLGILKARKIDPEGFAGLFHRLKDAGGVNSLPEFFGSHPDINNRIDYIQAAAMNAAAAEHPELENIFQKLKAIQ